MTTFSRTVLLVSFALLSSSCQKFRSQRRADFTPFAEQTIASISSLDNSLSQTRRVLTVDYVMEQSELLARVKQESADLDALLAGIVKYSVRIAELSRSKALEPQKIISLGEYIEGMRASLVGSADWGKLSDEEFDALANEVRAQETLLAALQAAQPLANGAGRAAAAIVIRLREDEREFEQRVQAALEADFASVRSYQRAYEAERDRLLDALALAYSSLNGDSAALEALRASPAVMSTKIGISDEQDWVRAVQSGLNKRLMSVNATGQAIALDYERYQALHDEVDQIVSEFDAALRETWGVIFVWTRAHDRMARGVVDPAEWFDVSDTPSAIFGLATKAL
jgi:hypothetical protein